MTKKMELLLITDQPIISYGLKLALDPIFPAGLTIHTTNAGAQFSRKAAQPRFGLLFYCFHHPRPENLMKLRLRYESVPTLVLSTISDPATLRKYYNMGVMGMIGLKSDADELNRAVMTVLQDQIYLSEAFMKSLIDTAPKNRYGDLSLKPKVPKALLAARGHGIGFLDN